MVGRVRQVVSDVLGVPLHEVNEESSQETVVPWDSLNILNLLLALEMEFGIQLDVGEAAQLVSVRAIVRALEARGAERGSGEAGRATQR